MNKLQSDNLMEKIEKLYTATASATGGRNGHEKAHQVCPYSNATRNNIEVELAIV